MQCITLYHRKYCVQCSDCQLKIKFEGYLLESIFSIMRKVHERIYSTVLTLLVICHLIPSDQAQFSEFRFWNISWENSEPKKVNFKKFEYAPKNHDMVAWGSALSEVAWRDICDVMFVAWRMWCRLVYKIFVIQTKERKDWLCQ